ncbi:MAG: phosphatidylglycerophosphatase A [Acidobacteria bacterium]|nr:phosphatidylglycerophosphatase A [Acidobacteriota bacterium]
MSWLRLVLATWFGSGYSPFASGTAGTLASIPLLLLLWWSGSVAAHAAALLAIVVIGLWAAWPAETYWRRKDPGHVVIDETAGYLLATLAVPPGPLPLVGSFVLFRGFDIVKPWPARRLEALPGAVGIMIDDLVAGLYANLVLQAALAAWRMLA